MSREKRVYEEELDYIGPVAIAQFIDCRWITVWPMGWTKPGLNAIRNGYGRWTGTQQTLPFGNTALLGGAAHWAGRRASPPGQ